MTRFIYYLSIFLIIFTVTSVGFASTNDDDDDDNIETVVNEDSDYYNHSNDGTGRRIAPRPIHITISSNNGVTIPNVDKSEVISYEIYDLNGNCIGAYIDDIDFANHLFSITNMVQIRIILEKSTLIGWIQI